MLVAVIVAAVVVVIVIVRVVMSPFMRMAMRVVMIAGMVAVVMFFVRSMFDVLVNLAAVTVLVVTAPAMRVTLAIGPRLGLERRG